MGSRFTDWIWHVRGSFSLGPGRSGRDAFDRLGPLFDKPGTTYQLSGDTLVFTKKDQAAQDRMSIFDAGTLRVERGVAGPTLSYNLKSKMLLLCFLAPLLFLGIAWITVEVGNLQTPAAEAAKADKKPAVKKPDPPMNALDKALGMPAPEKKKDKSDGPKKPSPTSAYVFAAIFALLYVVGRILEPYLVRNLFSTALA